MSVNRYKRLMAMSVTLMLWGTVLTSFMLWVNTRYGLRPWVSWENVHSNWNRVNAYPWAMMSPQDRRIALLIWWAIPVSTVISFIFLGFGEDVLREYRKVGSAVMSILQSRVLPKRKEKFRQVMLPVPPLPSSGLRFALLPTL